MWLYKCFPHILINSVIFKQSLTTKQRFPEGTPNYHQPASCFLPKSSRSCTCRDMAAIQGILLSHIFQTASMASVSLNKQNKTKTEIDRVLCLTLIPQNRLFSHCFDICITPKRPLVLNFIFNLVCVREFNTFYSLMYSCSQNFTHNHGCNFRVLMISLTVLFQGGMILQNTSLNT